MTAVAPADRCTADAKALLSVLDPDVLWAVYQHSQDAVNRAPYPEVIVFADELDEYWVEGEHAPGTELNSGAPLSLACPRCCAANSFCEVDASERWNDLCDDLVLKGNGAVGVHIYGAGTNYTSVAYMCRSCLMPVGMPDWVEPSWG